MLHCCSMAVARPNRRRRGALAKRRRWLVFAHQLPAHPSNGRVKTWRRLQQIGAVAMKNSVYVLPSTPQAREDFEWLRAEVMAAGGQATIFETGSLAASDETQILAKFASEDHPSVRPETRQSRAEADRSLFVAHTSTVTSPLVSSMSPQVGQLALMVATTISLPMSCCSIGVSLHNLSSETTRSGRR